MQVEELKSQLMATINKLMEERKAAEEALSKKIDEEIAESSA